MEHLPRGLIKKLDLETAAEQEASTWRNLIPPEPWQPAVSANPAKFAQWVAARLEAGTRNAPAWTVNARKAHQNLRPVAIVGIAERIAYRALVNYVLRDAEKPARSADDYRNFILGPIYAAYADKGPTIRLGDFTVGYVAEADIAAFYQYIDHSVLREELELQTADVEATARLIALLGEIQGRAFGLPQLLDPSDELSEVYIRILERDIVRKGIPLWRYNDDFRLALNAYDEAQVALELLGDSARRLGLVLNDRKTYISRFPKYLLRHLGYEVDDEDAQISPGDMKVWNSDYPNANPAELVSDADEILARLDAETKDRLDLATLNGDDVRQLRRAINILTQHRAPQGLPRVVDLILYVPELTPRVCEYMVTLHASGSDISDPWDRLTGEHTTALSDWQRTWLIYVARATAIVSLRDARIDWILAQQNSTSSAMLRAEASLALAELNATTFARLDEALRMEPEPMAPWYVLGMKAMSNVSQRQRKAVSESSPLYRFLLES